MFVIGIILLLIGGALLHDVPFPRFMAAIMCVIVGGAFMRLGML